MGKFITTFLLIAGLYGVSVGITAPEVKLETTLGEIVIQLDSSAAPKTVANFIEYVNGKFYNGTIFHRVIKTFMIQGGGMTPDMNEKPTRAPIANEADNGLKNLRGTIAMARTQDPNSASAQFFINTADNAFLNFRDKSVDGWGYCVFGKVISGMNVVDSIAKVQTKSIGNYQDVPTTPVVIKAANILKSKPAVK